MAKELAQEPQVTTSWGQSHDHGVQEVSDVEVVVAEVVEEVE